MDNSREEMMKKILHKTSLILNRILWAIALVGVNLILVAVVHIPILSAFVESTFLLKVFVFGVMAFSLYSLYLIFAKLSKAKVLVYVISLMTLTAALWIDDINVAYDIDSCLSSGGRWNYEQGACEGSRVEALNKLSDGNVYEDKGIREIKDGSI